MNDQDTEPPPPPRHDPLAALRIGNFRWYAGSRVLSGTGVTLLQAVIAWQVYEISGSPLQLGVLGLVRFVPALGMSLVGGAVADSYNRRTVLILALRPRAPVSRIGLIPFTLDPAGPN